MSFFRWLGEVLSPFKKIPVAIHDEVEKIKAAADKQIADLQANHTIQMTREKLLDEMKAADDFVVRFKALLQAEIDRK